MIRKRRQQGDDDGVDLEEILGCQARKHQHGVITTCQSAVRSVQKLQQLNEEPSPKRSRPSTDAAVLKAFESGPRWSEHDQTTQTWTETLDPDNAFNASEAVESSTASNGLDRCGGSIDELQMMVDTIPSTFEVLDVWIDEGIHWQIPSANDLGNRPRSLSDDIDSFLAYVRHQ